MGADGDGLISTGGRRVEFRLFGEVELRAADQLLDVGTPRQQAVLAALVVDAGRPVAIETLIDRVWDVSPPVEVRNVLYSHLSRLRQVLGQAAVVTQGTAVRIERRHAGYVVDIDPEVVDLHRFCRLIDQTCAPERSDSDRVRALTTALELWRGPPLAALAGRWADQVRSRWHRRRLDGVVQWAQAELRLGHPTVVVAILDDLVGEYPFVEPIEGLLMRALHAADRGAEAIDRYAIFRQRLAEDLGTDPGPELRALHQAILRGELPSSPVPGAGRAVPRPARFPGALPAVWKVAARNPNFTGRDDALAAVARDLSSGSTVTVHSVHGLGGVGKTQLAIEYAYTHASDYEVVWSITAEDPTTIPDQFAALARKLGLTPAADPSEVCDQVHDALRDIAGWLLIFDNADSVPGIHPWLPGIPLQAGTPGHAIVTTRRGGFASLGHVLDLDVLDLPAAVRLLRARVPALDQDIAELLGNQLGRLPLGLEQAAAYLDRTQTPAADYLHLLRTAPKAMLADGVVHAHGDSLATVWNLSLDRVTHEAPAAMELLGICAYLASEAIPLDLLTRHPDELPAPLAHAVADPVAFTKTIATLVDYSLAKRTPAGLQLHRLVQAAVRLRHQPTPQHAVALRLLYLDVPETIVGAPEVWPRWAVLLPHVLAVLDHVETNDSVGGYDEPTGKRVSWLLDRTGSYLRVHGRAREARPLLERALAIIEATYGPTHPTVAIRLNNLTRILRALGEPATARPLAERALAIAEDTHGPTHPEVATHLSNIALIVQDLGEPATARPLAERALAIAEDTYGPTHPEVATHLSNLAWFLRVLGEPATARPLAERALAIAEASYGPNHPIVAIRLSNLAWVLRALGDPATARPLLERALTIAEATYGPNHPTVATRLNNFASILRALGEPAAARPLAERALTITEASYGPNHPTVATRLSNLASILRALGEPATARPFAERALAITEATYGPTHPEVATRLSNLAQIVQDLGDPATARPFAERALAITEAAYGPTHPEVATRLSNLALIVQDLGEPATARPFAERALTIAEATCGPDHPTTQVIRKNLDALPFE